MHTKIKTIQVKEVENEFRIKQKRTIMNRNMAERKSRRLVT